MAFFKRLMDHLLNQVMVETLANSRWFQRFAVYTHRLTKEAAEKGERRQRTRGRHHSWQHTQHRSVRRWPPCMGSQSLLHSKCASAKHSSHSMWSFVCITRALLCCAGCVPARDRGAGKDGSKVLDEHVSVFMDKAKQVSSQVCCWALGDSTQQRRQQQQLVEWCCCSTG